MVEWPLSKTLNLCCFNEAALRPVRLVVKASIRPRVTVFCHIMTEAKRLLLRGFPGANSLIFFGFNVRVTVFGFKQICVQ